MVTCLHWTCVGRCNRDTSHCCCSVETNCPSTVVGYVNSIFIWVGRGRGGGGWGAGAKSWFSQAWKLSMQGMLAIHRFEKVCCLEITTTYWGSFQKPLSGDLIWDLLRDLVWALWSRHNLLQLCKLLSCVYIYVGVAVPHAFLNVAQRCSLPSSCLLTCNNRPRNTSLVAWHQQGMVKWLWWADRSPRELA